MAHTTDDAVTVAEAIGRAPHALEQAVARDAPVLYASAVRGAAVVLDPASISLGKRESVHDAAKSLSRWVDCIVAIIAVTVIIAIASRLATVA